MRSLRLFVVAVLGLLIGFSSAHAQSDARVSVLVTPFETADGVEENFGHQIMETIRDSLPTFQLLTQVDPDDVDDELEEIEEIMQRADDPPENAERFKWLGVASRLGVKLTIRGSVSQAEQGYVILAEATGTAPRGTMQLSSLQVDDVTDEDADKAARHILEDLRTLTDFLMARLNCEDYLASNFYSDAVRNCDRALEVYPENIRALITRAEIELERGNWELASKFLRRAVEEDPEDRDALEYLARAQAQLGNHEEASQLYLRYIDLSSQDFAARLAAARSLVEAGRIADADSVLGAGLELDPGHRQLKKYLEVVRQRAQEGDDKAGGTSPLRWTGTGDKSTQPFTVDKSGWQIRWSVQGGEMSSISIHVMNAESGERVTSASSNGPGTDDSYVYESGRFYLRIISANAQWAVEVDRGGS